MPESRPKRPRASRDAIAKISQELERALSRKRLVADPDLLENYATDESCAGSYVPQIAVRPKTTEDVEKSIAIAVRNGVPVVPRGGGTGRAGGCLAVEGGMVLAMEGMNRIISLDKSSFTATVQPGVVTGALHEAVEAEGMFYPPDPSSLDSCQIGGNVATNASGPRNPKYGPTRDQLLGLEVVLATGERLRLGGRALKGVAGYDLVSLFCGSEGTLGVITEVTLRLLPRPRHVETALLFFPGADLASRAVVAIMQAGHSPRALEMMDHVALEAIRPKALFRFPEGNQSSLILELDGNDKDALFASLASIGEQAESSLGASLVLVARDESQRRDIWASRRLLSPAIKERWGQKYAEDIAVPLSEVPRIVERVHQRAAEQELETAIFGHAGDGSLHVNILFQDQSAWPSVMRAAEAIFRDTVELGGTITSEHGIGILKRPYLALEQTPPLIALQRQMKRLFDPRDLMNPGKIFP